jgi:predicted pyridoxine 5'-phosphate oxidase superfamily flavin-nucleotide-binding protein
MARIEGNWGDYMRKLGIQEDTILLPAGRYLQTERNLRRNSRVQLLVATRKAQGTRGPGQGYLITGTAEIPESGEVVAAPASGSIAGGSSARSFSTCSGDML